MPRLKRGTTANRRGLTLPELLVAMLLLAIVGGGVTRVMIKQQQFYKDASKTAGAKRELRLGASVMPAELRSISSSGGDILEMSESEIRMRAYIGSAVICAINNDDIWVVPRNLARHTLTTYVTTPAGGDTAFVFNENTERGAQDDQWLKLVVMGTDLSNSACTVSPFIDPVLDPAATKGRRRYRLSAVLPPEVQVGSVVRFTRPVRYRIYQETSGAWYLGLEEYFGGSWGAASPMAGPFRPFAGSDNPTSGLQFRYYDSLGVRVTNMANKNDVARVDLFLRTNAGASAITERKGNALQDSVLMRIALRNFK
ncbi:MAG TPA: prepilin-type N-terminal cleavage/methylation domain-containing protein [Gemmatimonadaceae bacterium]